MQELNDPLIGDNSHALHAHVPKNAIGDFIEATVAAASKEDAIPMEVLISEYAEFRNSHIKAAGTIRSVSGLISTISSSILMWMILRSHIGLSTTQHRLLLGLCVSDLLSSLSYSTFNLVTPSDNYYKIWNARGTEATCDAQGFLASLGGFGGLFYNSSLTLYFLAVVKYNKSEDFIRAKIEPFLHIFPILIALSYSITRLAMDHYNADDSGFCLSTYHYPPHCQGYDVGEVREGEGEGEDFHIPCGRGIKGAGSSQHARMSLTLIPAIIMILSLGIIYGTVWKQEKKLSRYGVGALRAHLHQHQHHQQHHQQQQSPPAGQSSSSSSVWGKICVRLSKISSRLSIRSSRRSDRSNPTSRFNNTRSQSRAVMHKAFAYSFAWLLSYGSYLVGVALYFAGKEYPLFLSYISSIFLPLQGFFNLLIFMYPKVVNAKKSRGAGAGGRGESVTWRKAFVTAFWSKGNTGGKKRGPRNGTSRNRKLRSKRTKSTVNDSGRTTTTTTTTRAPQLDRTNERKKLECQKEEQEEEEEKCEIELPDDTMPHKKAAQPTYARNASPVQVSKKSMYTTTTTSSSTPVCSDDTPSLEGKKIIVEDENKRVSLHVLDAANVSEDAKSLTNVGEEDESIEE